MPPGKSAARKNPPARPGAMNSGGMGAHLSQAKSAINTANQVNHGMAQMGIKPQQAMAAMNAMAPMVPTRPGAGRPAPVVPKRPPTQKPPTIPSRPNM